MSKKKKNTSKEEAEKSLKEDFGEEGYKVLMDGTDAIIDITKEFGMPYKYVQKEIKESFEKGLVREKDGLYIGFKKKEETDEEDEEKKD
ncbi:MAG: hypothetical protein ACLFQV_00335 [Vulcanimicrobiota bacterium]